MYSWYSTKHHLLFSLFYDLDKIRHCLLFPRSILCWQNFSLDWCKQPDVGLPKPDLILFLQLQLTDAATRGEFGHERYEEKTFQERALCGFQQLMRDSTLNWKVRALKVG